MAKVFQTLKKKTIVLFVFVLFLSLATAVQTFPQSEESKLCHAVRSEGGIDANMACNITVRYSNGSNLVNFQVMDDLSDQFCYNLSSSDTSLKGLYNYELTCTNGVENETSSFSYLVNLGGIEPSQERTDALTRTILIFFGLALLTFISFLGMKKVPIKVTLFLLMIWFLLMGINASYISIQDEVVNANIENFFSFFLVISFWANYAILISIAVVWMVTFFVTLFERKKSKEVREYG